MEINKILNAINLKNKFLILLVCTSFSTYAQVIKWTLQDCIEHALENNINIRKADLRFKVAHTEKETAIGKFIPSLSSSIGHSWNIGLNTDPITNIKKLQTLQTSSMGINSNIVLFNGLRDLYQLHNANLSILSSQYQLENMKNNITLRIINAFLQVLFDKETLKTVRNQYNLNIEELNRTKELIEHGSKPKGDLLEMEANTVSKEQEIVQNENKLIISKIALANLLLIEDYNTFDIDDLDYHTSISIPQIKDYTAEKIYQKALYNQNDIKTSEIAIQIAENNLKIAKAGHLPTISASYSFNTNYSNSLETIFIDQLSNNIGHSFSLNLSIPIFNQFQVSSNVKKNQQEVQQAKLDLEETKINLKDKVYQIFIEVQNNLKSYEAANKTFIARKQAFIYSQNKFNIGMMNSFEFNQAKNKYENSQIEMIKYKYNYIFKLKVLEFYFGVPIR